MEPLNNFHTWGESLASLWEALVRRFMYLGIPQLANVLILETIMNTHAIANDSGACLGFISKQCQYWQKLC